MHAVMDQGFAEFSDLCSIVDQKFYCGLLVALYKLMQVILW